MPKHESANPTMTSNCPVLGACLLIRLPPPRNRRDPGLRVGGDGRDLSGSRDSRPLDDGFQVRIQSYGPSGQRRAVAGEQKDGPLDRPAGVLQVEAGVDVVAEPGQVEEVALARALRLEGELVEEAVEPAEGVAEARDRGLEVG